MVARRSDAAPARGSFASRPAVAAAVALLAAAAAPAAPVLYRQPAYQSPVRAEPDELLLLAGAGLVPGSRVVYATASRGAVPPELWPAAPEPRADSGEAEVVASVPAPWALVVHLPPAMRSRQTYALWVRTPDGATSDAVLINDARPLWVSPAYQYASAARPGLTRRLKVVGRNLDPAPGGRTELELSGPVRVRLRALAARERGVGEFVAEFALPKRLPAGEYSASLSRDGRSWVAVPDRPLVVLDDPPIERRFAVDAGGRAACRPDAGGDATDCLEQAIDAAVGAGGGAVVLGAGRWTLAATHAARRGDGIRLPRGVSLVGAGPRATIVQVAGAADADGPEPVFTLLGRNRVEGIRFVDRRVHRPNAYSSVLRLGEPWQRAERGAGERPSVEGVTVTGNIFDDPYSAIDSAGVPIADLVVTRNEFRAFFSALELGGDRFNVATPFKIADAIVSGNEFRPGRLFDPASGLGPLASELGAGLRVDFSDNRADGTAPDDSGSSSEPSGWRAGFFWHLNGNQEQVLVASNAILCPGDRAGDGEAIAYDNNANTFAFARAARVLAADAQSVTVDEQIRDHQHGREVPASTYYVGHWLFVVEGPGLGQARRIAGYAADAAIGTRFRVEPAWDVAPLAGSSRVTVGRNFWQVYTVGNTIDQRRPQCRKANASGPHGGGVSLWAQMTDSIVVANRQYDTSGIVRPHSYSAEDVLCPKCESWTMAAYFVDISRNEINEAYDSSSSCGPAGIRLAFAASPTPASPPPVMGFGVSVASNTIRRHDAFDGGAISVTRNWYPGPRPYDRPLVSGLIVQHNQIEDLPAPGGTAACTRAGVRRIGIDIRDAALVSSSVLYANRCSGTAQALRDEGRGTLALCASPIVDRCECQAGR